MSSLEEISRDNGAFSPLKAQAHLTLLRMFCAVYDSMTVLFHPAQPIPPQMTPEQKEQLLDHYLLVAHWRYRWYLDVIATMKDAPRDTWPAPQWDVALMMHTHMLNPVAFQRDISSSIRYNGLAGLVDFPLMKLDYNLRHLNEPVQSADVTLWFTKNAKTRVYKMIELINPGSHTFPPEMYISIHYLPKNFKLKARPPPFSIDLRAAVKRQIAFARKITSVYPYDPVPENLLLDSQQRYAKFMNLIRMNQNPAIVPAVDIDLFWHTHQLTATNYLPWCTHHVGFPINHDDTVGGGELATTLDDTVSAWETAYSEDYLNPSPGPVSQNFPAPPPREPNTLDKTPPPGLTLAQQRLWNFDVQHQEMHERLNSLLREQRVTLKVYNQKVAALPPAPSLSSSEARGGGGSFMKRLLKVGASAFDKERESLVANQKGLALYIQQQIRDAMESRQGWGRQRWPLLVAARGWGDPRVTEGKWVRPPQGTASLDFPIYAATWYDNKELGWYDYVTGGREGGSGVEGGGVRVGGAMCAGRFDGGNCVAYVYRPSAGNDGGGGGG